MTKLAQSKEDCILKENDKWASVDEIVINSLRK